MTQRTLGDRSVGSVGLGCMGMSHAYGSPDEAESLRVLDRSLELGCDHWDTADMYGQGANEILVAKALKKHRDKVFLASKFANVFDRTLTSHQDLVAANAPLIVDGTPAYVRKAIEKNLGRLEVDCIDLYYLHRVDDRVPIEETVGAMAELVSEGKVRFLGLSEVGPETLRRAHKTHPIAAVQMEYSLWTRDIEADTIPAARELGVPVVAYSPLGRGFLTGQFTKFDDFVEGDYRRTSPRFQPENIDANLELVRVIEGVGAKHGATSAQVAIAWVLAQGQDILPIPGTKKTKWLEDNAAADSVKLDAEDLAVLDGLTAAGERYPELAMTFTKR